MEFLFTLHLKEDKWYKSNSIETLSGIWKMQRGKYTMAQQIAFQSRPANVAIPPIIYLRPDIKFLVWFYFVCYVTYTLFFQET